MVFGSNRGTLPLTFLSRTEKLLWFYMNQCMKFKRVHSTVCWEENRDKMSVSSFGLPLVNLLRDKSTVVVVIHECGSPVTSQHRVVI